LGDAPAQGARSIRQIQLTSEQVHGSYFTNRQSMRGSGAAAVEFRWYFLDDAATGVPVGSAFRTRLVALDAQGHPGRCDGLRVNVSLGGSARLSPGAALNRWNGSEMELSMEDGIAETVDVQVHVEGPAIGTVSHRSPIRFVPAVVSQLNLGVRALALTSANHSRSLQPLREGSSAPGSRWPTLVVLEVVLGMPSDGGTNCGSFHLRSGDRRLEILSPSGRFHSNSRGEAVVLVRGTSPGSISVWVEPWGGSSVDGNKQSAVQLHFADPPGSISIPRGSSNNGTTDKWKDLADEVREAFLHAWSGYKRNAWGSDELKPISLEGKDTFGNIGMTIIDSLTTLWLMGLKSEFDEGLAFVERDLDFDTADREISVFEVVIRALGGLLGAHSLSGRQIFLERAIELAERILPAMNTSSGLPLPRWNLARGLGKSTYDPRKEPTILAEAGSFQLEFRYLSAVTGDLRYSKAAEVASQAIRDAGADGLVPVHLTPAEGGKPQLMPDRLAMGALADSYYEYLLKQWLQSPEETHHRDAWLAVMDALPSLVVPDPRAEGSGSSKLQLLEMNRQGGLLWKMDHLSCFVPGMIALGLRHMSDDELLQNSRNETWHRMAAGLTSTCAHLWMDTKSGLAPEFVFFDKMKSGEKTIPRGAQHSYLRPETAESLFYLYRMTGQTRYRKWGKKLFRSIVEHSQVAGGYGSVEDVTVVPTKKMDEMQSFVMAETFKYLYLLFSPTEAFDLDRYVLNTEGHPLRKLTPW